jgi:hypothetical protein
MELHKAKQTISLGTPACILVHDVNLHSDTKFYRRLSLCSPGSSGEVILSLLHYPPVWPPMDLGNPLDNGLDFKPLLSGCRVGTQLLDDVKGGLEGQQHRFFFPCCVAAGLLAVHSAGHAHFVRVGSKHLLMFTGLATMKLQAKRMGRVVFLKKRSMQVKTRFGAAICRPTH